MRDVTFLIYCFISIFIIEKSYDLINYLIERNRVNEHY